jgi:hypothetical protein
VFVWELVSYWPVLLYFGFESVDHFFRCYQFLETFSDFNSDLDILLVRETLEKNLKSERLKLEIKVNSKKCLFYYSKIF